MEYVPGITLSEKITHPLPEKDVFRLGVQLAEGLAAVHRAGSIDFRPNPLGSTLSQQGREEDICQGHHLWRRVG